MKKVIFFILFFLIIFPFTIKAKIKANKAKKKHTEFGLIIFFQYEKIGNSIEIFMKKCDLNNGKKTVLLRKNIDRFVKPAWNPKTSEVFVSSHNNRHEPNISAINIDNGKIRQIMNVQHAISAIACNKWGDFVYRISKIVNKKPYSFIADRKIDFYVVGGLNAVWHPTNRHMILISMPDQSLKLFNLSFEKEYLISSKAYSPQWAAKGRYIYFDNRKKIFCFDLKTNKAVFLVKGKNTRLSLDGKWIIFNDNTNYFILNNNRNKEFKTIFPIKFLWGRIPKIKFLGWDQGKAIFLEIYIDPTGKRTCARPGHHDQQQYNANIVAVKLSTRKKINLAVIYDIQPNLIENFTYIKKGH